MQETTPAIPPWLFQTLQNLAWFGAGGLILKLITLWQNRKKPAAEIVKLEDEATEIRIRSRVVAGDSWLRMMDRLDQAATKNENLRSQRDDLQEKCDKLEMEVESCDRQMRKMKAYMDFKGLRYSEMDEPR